MVDILKLAQYSARHDGVTTIEDILAVDPELVNEVVEYGVDDDIIERDNISRKMNRAIRRKNTVAAHNKLLRRAKYVFYRQPDNFTAIKILKKNGRERYAFMKVERRKEVFDYDAIISDDTEMRGIERTELEYSKACQPSEYARKWHEFNSMVCDYCNANEHESYTFEEGCHLNVITW